MSRTNEEINADLSASAEDLAWLKEADPLAALAHPNCPKEMWWDLADRHPIEAETSPLFLLMQLESPGRWEELELNGAYIWQHPYIQRLPDAAKLLLIADCVERAVPAFAQVYPDDDRVEAVYPDAPPSNRWRCNGGGAIGRTKKNRSGRRHPRLGS